MLDQLTTSVVLLHAAGWGNDEPWFWIWRLGMFIFWIFLFFLFFWVFRRWSWGWRHEISGTERARGILAERFARGEISAEEYHQRLDQLK